MLPIYYYAKAVALSFSTVADLFTSIDSERFCKLDFYINGFNRIVSVVGMPIITVFGTGSFFGLSTIFRPATFYIPLKFYLDSILIFYFILY